MIIGFYQNRVCQGWCICGECGHTLGCQQKDASERRYHGGSGRGKDTHLDGLTPLEALKKLYELKGRMEG